MTYDELMQTVQATFLVVIFFVGLIAAADIHGEQDAHTELLEELIEEVEDLGRC